MALNPKDVTIDGTFAGSEGSLNAKVKNTPTQKPTYFFDIVLVNQIDKI